MTMGKSIFGQALAFLGDRQLLAFRGLPSFAERWQPTGKKWPAALPTDWAGSIGWRLEHDEKVEPILAF